MKARTLKSSGFTLIEMLVVVAIIIVVVTMSLSMLNMRNQAARNAGSMIQGTFTLARQLASSERTIIWVVLMPHTENATTVYDRLVLCRDTGATVGQWDGTDEPIDAPVVLPKAVQFDAPAMPMLASAGGAARALGYRPDGSVQLPTGVADLTWSPAATQADLVVVLIQPGAASKKVFLDLSAITGSFRRIEYQ